MRVLQAMAGAEFGGAEAFFVRLCIGLHKAGLNQKVIIRENPARAALLRAEGIEPVELPFGGRFDFKTKRAMSREIREYSPDVVMTWMNRATDKCPKGNFVHAARLGGYYNLKYYQKCDHLIGNTQDIVEYLVKEGRARDSVHYLPNFVAAEAGKPADRGQFYTPHDAQLVVAMGRLHKNKAFDTLIDAMTRLPDAYLWLAGEGPERLALEKQAEKLGIKPRIRFLGWRDDTASLLAAADVFVCPSRHEPLGNVVLEAWAQGAAVVAADSLGPGTLIDHMENGLLSAVDDTKALARSIGAVLNDEALAAKISAAGHETYMKHFTEASVVEKYMEFFHAVATQEA